MAAISLILINLKILMAIGVHNMKIFIMQCSSASYCFCPLTPNRSLQHRVLKHPYSVLRKSSRATSHVSQPVKNWTWLTAPEGFTNFSRCETFKSYSMFVPSCESPSFTPIQIYRYPITRETDLAGMRPIQRHRKSDRIHAQDTR
jgi:hypothetical protein